MIIFLASLLQCIIGQNLVRILVIFLYINGDFFLYTLFSLSLLIELLLIILNDIHAKPKQLVIRLNARLPKCVSVCSKVLCLYLGGLSSTISIPIVIYFSYGSTTNF